MPQKWIIRDYYKQSYVNKMDNLEELGKFLEMYNLPQWIKKKQKTWTGQLPVMKLNNEEKNSKQTEVQKQLYPWRILQNV